MNTLSPLLQLEPCSRARRAGVNGPVTRSSSGHLFEAKTKTLTYRQFAADAARERIRRICRLLAPGGRQTTPASMSAFRVSAQPVDASAADHRALSDSEEL
jgi:hypothetical protein